MRRLGSRGSTVLLVILSLTLVLVASTGILNYIAGASNRAFSRKMDAEQGFYFAEAAAVAMLENNKTGGAVTGQVLPVMDYAAVLDSVPGTGPNAAVKYPAATKLLDSGRSIMNAPSYEPLDGAVTVVGADTRFCGKYALESGQNFSVCFGPPPP